MPLSEVKTMPSDSISRRSFVKSAILGAAACAAGKSLELPAEASSGHGLKRASPESVGVSPSAILAFVEAVEQNVNGLHSFMLLRHGKVAAEAWWAPYAPQHPHMLFSLSKSF